MAARDLTFFPPDGTFNYDKDKHYKALHASSPIPLNDLPRFLMDGLLPGFHPPRLWCGWPLVDVTVIKLVEKHFPEDVCYDEHGDADMILALGNLCERIHEVFEIPLEHQEWVKLADMGNEDGESVIMLCVGWNDVGFSPLKEYIEILQDGLFEGKEPWWYLCAHKFGWSKDKAETDITVEEMVAFIRGVNAGMTNTETGSDVAEATSTCKRTSSLNLVF